MNPAITASTQWLERTLDDSANRRISIPEAFLAVDAILNLVINIISGCTVYPAIMERHLREELPFLATENILMRAVELGGDRQELHEVIREYSVERAARTTSRKSSSRTGASSSTGRRFRRYWTYASSWAWPRSRRAPSPPGCANCSLRTPRSSPPKGRVR